MGSWDFAIALDSGAAQPLFLQIARGIAQAVKQGRLRPGDKLPGTRALASTLGVHRNTTIAAYDELVAEGWLQSRATGGTYVNTDLPDPSPRAFAPAPVETGLTSHSEPGFPLASAPPPRRKPAAPPETLPLSAVDADLRLVPLDALARAYRRALMSEGPQILGPGDPRGHRRLRSALAGMLAATRGVACQPDNLLVTRGSQMALFLTARALVQPGDVVAIESLGYRFGWEAFASAGARLAPLPVDGQGLVVDALAELASRQQVRAVYLTPHHHYPTTVTLSPGRRLQLLELAAARGIAVVEDDYDNEFHYDGRPILPLASADPAGVVVYVGTLSKILAPGLRMGFVAAPRAVIDRMAGLRGAIDGQGDLVVECAVAELLEDREVQRHASRMRRTYRARRDALVLALREHLGGALSFQQPAGGMALWANVDPAIDLAAWSDRAVARGVSIQPPGRFAYEGPEPHAVRVGFACLSPEELVEAVRRLRDAL